MSSVYKYRKEAVIEVGAFRTLINGSVIALSKIIELEMYNSGIKNKIHVVSALVITHFLYAVRFE